ncbi:ATP-dependent helicase HrpB [bacterium (Candidatus Blackallbacteria) CG17_big_fil_post_rev_8_21_14_2_50_48_46]|uniref:ATP-dependent helicase HrpB n=1 Tax=bacterium (Candidatus Blackallbacteria) CG17_big_fil_post_rev_8_21_14_2_50_48_46 TaxID=2014261 RepID=A0A2M7G0Q2_9BACT|nr:MAG: ATP-dependent helicase HrpB [bacterium (Candidatus Blackallbacteria) CG18_big_fil_WC_8_21_14_2_50_49_26]PIW15262.1 MAG: ATP-dependent helicase HrpB [bacterium (Candidatus Blackallbacteria) CG17_big_fil_post_rev_8_21_14_2_50_48_46]PIW45229.1 MAG: ATP-dependent helicase HrpB [bacterium (Candidatus Blackallbacteria) CG13_big_fil_rev_8_21_14_2_50_49_14]
MNLNALLPELGLQLETSLCVILEAPPGTGKTTTVPPALLNAPWLAGQKILMLEPRRLAAKSAARYMAQQRSEQVGQSVGYRVRMETRVSAQTRIEVVTEGVLTRMLQSDPALEGVGLVIFDEFHERSLQADLGLALCRESQQVLREDLRLLIMSATLPERLAGLLGDVPVLRAGGVTHPVSLRYAPPPLGGDELAHAAGVIRQALREEAGSLLVFLPGSGEIRRLAERLGDLPANCQVTPLYGDLAPIEQDRAIQPAPAGQRKIVLATNIAETSLTIEGIRGVIDLGQERTPVFDPISGMTRLTTRRISRASALQRQGRAGRLEPGFCIRLWQESDTARLLPEIEPEILSADLAPLVLELAQWGCSDPFQLAWLDPPPSVPWEQAQSLLQALGALDAKGLMTSHGKALVGLPLHPRLGHMVLKAREQNLGGLACTLAALLSERDIFKGAASRDADLGSRLQALSRGRAGRQEAIQKAAAQVGEKLGLKPAFHPIEELGLLIGLAYPERLAQRRGESARYRLANGRGAVLPEGDFLAREPLLAIAQLDGHPREAKIFLAAALSPEQLELLSEAQTETGLEVSFNQQTGSVQAWRVTRYGALVLKKERIQNPDADTLALALLEGVRQKGIAKLPWSENQLELRERVAFLHRHQPQDWPDLSDDALKSALKDWLLPFLTGLKRLEAITPALLQQALEYYLGYEKLALLDSWAPSHWPVPSGSRIRLDYSGEEPVLAARLQELFGMLDTPKILGGRAPLLIHLLSPARRPVQVTRDLASFWRETYPEVKKELKGRYPKHYWPEDPLQAEAVRGIKRKPEPKA